MRIACVTWYTSSVGGIATHLNTLRRAAIREGDHFDILHSRNWKNKTPALFPERKWIRGGDTNIWVDGEIPSGERNAESSARWLEANYDAVLFGFICPHQRKNYPRPEFLPLYDTRLPKVAWVMDGYWHDYSHWAEPLLPKLKGVLCPLESYASPLRALGVKNLVISPFPFLPALGRSEPKSSTPLLVWPNQFKDIKGLRYFLAAVPDLPNEVDVEMYSNGIRYYQWRTTDLWKKTVKTDHWQGFHGEGRAQFFGNVDLPVITKVYQRAWFTVNLQGITARNDTYRQGSYNNTEVEALWYGACPILHESTLKTDLPPEVYLPVGGGQEIPNVVRAALAPNFALDPIRRARAREFVADKHLASKRYQDVKRLFEG
jgi:hypothetical protein